jgi:hypothetical protein
MALERELKTYQNKLLQLLDHEGEFVVIHGEEVAGIWGDYTAALQNAYEKFGLSEPFFIKRIEAVETPQFFSRRVSSCES